MRICDYGTPEFKRKCRNNATKTVRVKYNDREQDVFYLCEKCSQSLNNEAVSKKWQITIRDYECLRSKN